MDYRGPGVTAVGPRQKAVADSERLVGRAYTNGRLRSPYHRVAMVGNKDRFSLQLFSAPNVFYKIEAPKELVDEEHPLLFKPYDLLGYAQYIAIRANQGFPNVLKSFCGV
uniref:2-oxoglutarate-dependent dioxygenase AOP3-like n=1 Tax=Nicotiana tabacum TaxID=4097 RepID=A0A1S4D8W2_TOBAC|nr:PREDICTED: 2-oxoglutarate-dependent dioxygenase AOP3-like [Nicotiana tabacum]